MTINYVVPSWTVAECKTSFLVGLDVLRSEPMFSDGQIAKMYDRSGVRQDIDIGRNRRLDAFATQ